MALNSTFSSPNKCTFVVSRRNANSFEDYFVYDVVLNPNTFTHKFSPIYDTKGAAGFPGTKNDWVRNDAEVISFELYISGFTKEYMGAKTDSNILEPRIQQDRVDISPDLAFLTSLVVPDLEKWTGGSLQPDLFETPPEVYFYKGVHVYIGHITSMQIKETLHNKLMEPIEATVSIDFTVNFSDFDRIKSSYDKLLTERNRGWQI